MIDIRCYVDGDHDGDCDGGCMIRAELCRCKPPKPYRDSASKVRCAWCERLIS